jgi:NADPH-dependent 7-cyano-7-deazaguanine reductase QueF-like protein
MLKDKNTGETWEGVIGNLPLNDSYNIVKNEKSYKKYLNIYLEKKVKFKDKINDRYEEGIVRDKIIKFLKREAK